MSASASIPSLRRGVRVRGEDRSGLLKVEKKGERIGMHTASWLQSLQKWVRKTFLHVFKNKKVYPGGDKILYLCFLKFLLNYFKILTTNHSPGN